jgi:hypothetical protein
MNNSDFSHWFDQLMAEMGLPDSVGLTKDKSIIVHGVICTFVHPVGACDELATVLLDAGKMDLPRDTDYLLSALGRNLENFLMGSPLFILNAESQHLVIGQQFRFSSIPQATFVGLLDSLALQALAWQQRQGYA